MSSYLVAFVICDFKLKSLFTKTSVRVDVAAKPQSIDDGDGDFALREATEILEFFEVFLKQPYPMEVSSNFKDENNFLILKYLIFNYY